MNGSGGGGVGDEAAGRLESMWASNSLAGGEGVAAAVDTTCNGGIGGDGHRQHARQYQSQSMWASNPLAGGEDASVVADTPCNEVAETKGDDGAGDVVSGGSTTVNPLDRIRARMQAKAQKKKFKTPAAPSAPPAPPAPPTSPGTGVTPIAVVPIATTPYDAASDIPATPKAKTRSVTFRSGSVTEHTLIVTSGGGEDDGLEGSLARTATTASSPTLPGEAGSQHSPDAPARDVQQRQRLASLIVIPDTLGSEVDQHAASRRLSVVVPAPPHQHVGYDMVTWQARIDATQASLEARERALEVEEAECDRVNAARSKELAMGAAMIDRQEEVLEAVEQQMRQEFTDTQTVVSNHAPLQGARDRASQENRELRRVLAGLGAQGDEVARVEEAEIRRREAVVDHHNLMIAKLRANNAFQKDRIARARGRPPPLRGTFR